MFTCDVMRAVITKYGKQMPHILHLLLLAAAFLGNLRWAH